MTCGYVGRTREIGIYRCARAVRTGLGLRITTFGETRGRISTTFASHKLGNYSGSAALVVMVQPTDLRDLDDRTHTGRVDGSGLRGVFAEREMRSRLVVIGKVRGQDSTEMLLAEDNHVIETISTNGSDKPLSVGILPGRPRCCEHLVDSDAAHSTAKLVSVDAIAIADPCTWAQYPLEMSR